MSNKISLIIATKDRPDDLHRLLVSLRLQIVCPDDITIVDASHDSCDSVIADFPDLNLRYLRHWPPSSAAQRNIGIRVCTPTTSLIGFADDDTIFERKAFENMLKFWKHAEPNVMGASFNIRNYPQRGKTFLKHSTLTEMLGLYSPNIGHVSLSGWHTVIPEVTKTQYVDWVPSTAVIYRRNILEQYIFDEFYESYSYLEDLDLGYTVSRIGRLAVIVDAGFSHYPSSKGRITDRNFGRYEVRNRIHFVRKHHLSLIRCYICLAIRITMSGSLGVIYRDIGLLLRALGNLEEIAWRHSVQ